MSYYCDYGGFICKYCDDEGCFFDSQGSGNEIDMPCYDPDEDEFMPEPDTVRPIEEPTITINGTQMPYMAFPRIEGTLDVETGVLTIS